MRIDPIAFALALVLGAIVSIPETHACGYWEVDDVDLGLRVTFLIGHTRVEYSGVGSVHLGGDYLPSTMEITDGAIVYRGSEVGRWSEGAATLAGETFTIEVGSPGEEKCGVGTAVRVTRDARVVVDEEFDQGDADACEWREKGDAIRKIEKRLVLYLIWRQKFLEDVREKVAGLPENRIEAARQLTAELERKGNYRRTVATRALVELGAPAVPALTEALDRKSMRRARFAQVHALKGLGEDARFARLDLLDLQGTGGRALERLIGRAIEALGVDSED